MRIENANIQLTSQRTYVEKHVKKESLRVWVGNERPDFEEFEPQPVVFPGRGIDTVSISAMARDRLLAAAQNEDAVQETEASEATTDPENDPETLVIRLIVEQMTGKRIKLLSRKDINPEGQIEQRADVSQARGDGSPPREGFGVEYDSYQMDYESESTTFSASGVIRTADGKDIEFTTELSMSREFKSEQSVSVRAGDAVKKDPLVINFSGTAAQLTSARFTFDIDADGTQDKIPFVQSGSGFLALDLNNDGAINDGSELFGPTTGDGFAELAAHDEDTNGWIDENDPAYENLLVWSKDPQGKDSLVGLDQKNVGALYLGNVSTPLDVKNEQNEMLGQVKATSVYVKEDGSTGTTQQVDLAV